MSRCQIVISVALLLAMGMTTRADETSDEADAALSEAITKLKAWRASFSRLQIKWKWSNPGQLIERMPELRDDPVGLAGWYRIYNWAWTDRQQIRLIKEDFERGELVSRDRYVTGRVDGTERPMVIDQTYQGGNYPWLSDWFDQFPRKAVGVEIFDGSRCVGYRPAADSQAIIWLDLDHDGLVHQYDNPSALGGCFYDCKEFQQIETGQWFPLRGQYGSMRWNETPYWFEVLSVTINDIPDEEFSIPAVVPKIAPTAEEMNSRRFHYRWWRVEVTVGVFVVILLVSAFGLRGKTVGENSKP